MRAPLATRRFGKLSLAVAGRMNEGLAGNRAQMSREGMTDLDNKL